MNLDHTPHPLIEDHYHIRELIEAQEKRHDERLYSRDKAKAKQEREELIADAKRLVLTDFWCDRCKEDFKGMAWKQVVQDWYTDSRSAFYKTKCFKGHWCIRLITDKYKDGFFVKSRKLAHERGKYHNDIIQPGDTNYQLLYGKKNA